MATNLETIAWSHGYSYSEYRSHGGTFSREDYYEYWSAMDQEHEEWIMNQGRCGGVINEG